MLPAHSVSWLDTPTKQHMLCVLVDYVRRILRTDSLVYVVSTDIGAHRYRDQKRVRSVGKEVRTQSAVMYLNTIIR